MPPIFASTVVRRFAAYLVAATALTTASLPARAEPVSVMIDHAKVMRISRPADMVIIGNPAIADATIRDNRTLIITGKSYGTTNLIVLDAEGQSIADEIITVAAPNNQVVTVYRRSARQSYSCAPDCAPILIVGDNEAAFKSINEQIMARSSLTSSAAAQ